MQALDLQAFTIATQTYTRRQDWAVISALAGVGMTLYKLAFDLRLLQSPPIGEWAEPFGNASGRLVGHALQAQPDQRREYRQPGALPGDSAARRLG